MSFSFLSFKKKCNFYLNGGNSSDTINADAREISMNYVVCDYIRQEMGLPSATAMMCTLLGTDRKSLPNRVMTEEQLMHSMGYLVCVLQVARENTPYQDPNPKNIKV